MRALFVSIFAVLFISDLSALDPTKDVAQFIHHSWQVEQGLPNNSVYSLVQTKEGYLWVGTQEGLARFDGVRFTVFNSQTNPELRNNWIWTLMESRDGSLWIGTNGGGLTRYKAGKFQTWTRANGLAEDSIRALCEDEVGNLWIGTTNGLSRIREGKLTSFTMKEGLPHNRILALSLDRQGNLWIGFDTGLCRYRDGKFTSLTKEHGLPDGMVWILHQDSQERIWIGTHEGGLFRFNDKDSHLSRDERIPGDRMRSSFEDRSGALWIGSSEGLCRLYKDRLSVYNPDHLLSDYWMLSILEDREGTVWIGTGGAGLHALHESKFETITAKDGLSSDSIYCITGDKNGNKWVGTYNGLNLIRNHDIMRIDERYNMPRDPIRTLLIDRAQDLWIGADSGLYRLSRNQTKVDTILRTGSWISLLREGSQGEIWIVSKNLYVYKQGKLQLVPDHLKLWQIGIQSVFQDSNGSLWIGTDGRGLVRISNGHPTVFTQKNGLAGDKVISFYEDADRTLWIGSLGGGLSRFQNGKFTSYTTRDGLFDNVMYMILEDENHYLWMNSNRGIFRVNKKELNDFAERKTKTISCLSFTTLDGLKSSEASMQTPGAWISPDSRLWFGTEKGLAIINPLRILRNETPPPVILEKVVADGVIREGSNELNLQPGTKSFEFQYTALSFRVPERVRFRYMLEGYNNQWVEAGTRRTAYYTNLAPRSYHFRVIACNEDGVWNRVGATILFNLKPYFYQTRWFPVVCMVGAVSLGFGFHRLRTARLKKLVAARTMELQESNSKLLEAQERISRLLSSQPHAPEDIGVWLRSAAEDIARVIGAASIDIWILEGETLQSTGSAAVPAPSLESLRQGTKSADPLQTVLSITGNSGQIYGALSITGGNRSLDDTEMRLVTGLANQIAGVLELHRLQRDLAQAKEKRAARIQEMRDRGIITVKVCPHCNRCYGDSLEDCPSDHSKLQAPEILPLRIADRYSLTRLLGQGGTGLVFQANDEKLRRFVAVKILRREFLSDPFIQTRWEREARVVARLRHPGIVSLYDLGELSDGSGFLVMEFLDGVDLARIVRKYGAGTPLQVAEVLRQVADALEHAHNAGIIHRDLKPANIFLVPASEGFQVKVVDFGLAKSLREDAALTRTGVLLGSPSYMSPEQARGLSLDQRSDLFSLASLIYELLTGRVAFHAESVSEVLARILSVNPEPLPDKELENALALALEKDPEKRPPTVRCWVDSILPLIRSINGSATGWPIELLRSEIVQSPDPYFPTQEM